MKLLIDGKEYEVAEAISHLSLTDAYRLKVVCGVGVSTLMNQLNDMVKLDDPLDDEVGLRSLISLVWLCRTCGGEKNLTFDAAGEFDLSTFKLIGDDDEDEADPTSVLTASGQDADEPAEAVEDSQTLV